MVYDQKHQALADDKSPCADIKTINRLIEKHDLPMKLVQIKRERGNLTVYFSADNRVDFRNLARELNTTFGEPVRLHQVGSRDEAKMIGGIGPCQKSLCCKTFLSKFESIPQTLIKKQGLTSNLAQSTGICGKLMCCLTFELQEKLPVKQGEENLKVDEKLKLEKPISVIEENPISAPSSPAISAPVEKKKHPVQPDKEDGEKTFPPQTTKKVVRKLQIKKVKK